MDPSNSVYEVNSVGVPTGESNPHGNAFVAEETLLATEKAAQRRVNCGERSLLARGESGQKEPAGPAGGIPSCSRRKLPAAGSAGCKDHAARRVSPQIMFG